MRILRFELAYIFLKRINFCFECKKRSWKQLFKIRTQENKNYDIFFFFVFSEDEKEREKILKELRNVVKENCLMIGKINVANEIRKQLIFPDDLDMSQSMEMIMKVNRTLSWNN